MGRYENVTWVVFVSYTMLRFIGASNDGLEFLTLILENSIYAVLDIAELPRKVAELLAHLTSVMKKSYICQVGYKIYPRSRGGPTNAIATARKGLHR